MKQKTIENPYSPGRTNNHITRVQAFIEDSDYKLVRRSADGDGVLSAVIAILWQKLVSRLRTYGITDYTRNEDFIELINNLDVVYTGKDINILRDSVNGGTVDRVVTAADASNDSGAVEGVRSETTGKTNLSSDLQSGGESKETVKRGVKRAGKGV